MDNSLMVYKENISLAGFDEATFSLGGPHGKKIRPLAKSLLGTKTSSPRALVEIKFCQPHVNEFRSEYFLN